MINIIVNGETKESINSYQVSNTVFSNATNIKSVDLQHIPVKDGNMCFFFNRLTKLESVTNINENVTNMYYSFIGCSNLVNAPVIPNSVTDMYGTFSSCSNLVNAPIIPNSITNLHYTFSGCSNLVNAPEIPNSVEYVNGTFSNCISLVNAPVIPNTVIGLGSAFQGCTNLVNGPEIPDSVTTMYGTFTNCINLVNAQIGNNVINCYGTFAGCDKIVTSPIIPNNVQNISCMFNGCSNLEGNIYLHSPSIQNSWSFANTFTTQKPLNIYIPFGNSSTYQTIYNNFNNVANITIHELDGYATSGDWYYYVPTNTLTTYVGSSAIVTIPDTINGNAANIVPPCYMFANNNTITNVYAEPSIRNKMTDMTNMFGYCTNLVNAYNVCGTNVTNLYYTFYTTNISSIPDLSLSTNLKNMCGAFSYCNKITSVGSLPDNIENMDSAFFDCVNLTSLSPLPANLISCNYTFKNCWALRNSPSFEKCNKLETMYYTFENCFNLVNVGTLPPNVTNMFQAFLNCYNLVNAPVIPNSVTRLYGTFNRCFNLVNSPAIPNSVVSMEDTFYQCTKFVNAPAIPNSVINMYRTFIQCPSLVNAPAIPNSVINMSHTFSSCSNLINAPELPSGVINLSGTFGACTNMINFPTIPNCVNDMSYTFQCCFNLVNAPVIPNSVTNMFYTFCGCHNLVNVPAIPNSVIDMSRAFEECYNLLNGVTLSANATNLYRTYYNCVNITNVPAIPNTVTDMNETFYNTAITNFPDIPQNVTKVSNCFGNCQNAKGSIIIRSSNITSATNCFYNTAKQKSVYMPVDNYQQVEIGVSDYTEGPSADIVDHILTASSSYSYITKTLTYEIAEADTTSMEFGCSFTPLDIITDCRPMISVNSGNYRFSLGWQYGSTFYFQYRNSSVGQTVSFYTSVPANVNEKVYLKLRWEKETGEYTLYKSSDGITYEYVTSAINTTLGPFMLPLMKAGNNYYSPYKMDLKDLYIKQNDTEVWRAFKGTGVYEEQNIYTATYRAFNKAYPDNSPDGNMIGTLTNNSGVISGFSSSNMLVLDVFNPVSTDSFDMQFKVTTGSSFSGIQEIFAVGIPLLVRIDGSSFELAYNNGSTWSIRTLMSASANTTYYVIVRYFPVETTKDGYTYTAKNLYEEIYDSNKSLLNRYNYDISSTFLAFTTYEARIGTQGDSEPWTGSIDLNESFVKWNDKLWWRGLARPNGVNIIDMEKVSDEEYDVTVDGNNIILNSYKLDDKNVIVLPIVNSGE